MAVAACAHFPAQKSLFLVTRVKTDFVSGCTHGHTGAAAAVTQHVIPNCKAHRQRYLPTPEHRRYQPSYRMQIRHLRARGLDDRYP